MEVVNLLLTAFCHRDVQLDGQGGQVVWIFDLQGHRSERLFAAGTGTGVDAILSPFSSAASASLAHSMRFRSMWSPDLCSLLEVRNQSTPSNGLMWFLSRYSALQMEQRIIRSVINKNTSDQTTVALMLGTDDFSLTRSEEQSWRLHCVSVKVK